MALIDSASTNPGPGDWRMSRAYQQYLALLERIQREPVSEPEPFVPVESFELIDGPAPAPKPEKAKLRKRRRARKADLPSPDADAMNLKRYARKLRGEL